MDLHRDAWRTEFKMLSSFISHSFERIKINNKKKPERKGTPDKTSRKQVYINKIRKNVVYITRPKR